MGAYSNPQEIEGQQDLGAYSRSLQKMFDTVTAGAMNASDNITKIKLAQSERILQENKQNAAKNENILRELNSKEQDYRIMVEKGKGAAPVGMNYDCYNSALDRWRELQKSIDYGTATNADKREAAQIIASVDGFVRGAANTAGVIEKIRVAKNNVGDGQIDLKGSDPYMFRAYVALESKNGEQIQPDFQTITDAEGNSKTDYSQPGYTVRAWTEKNPNTGEVIQHGDKFISAKELEASLNGGGDGGIVFQKSFEGDNDKVRKAYKADAEGNGIFEYKNDTYTNKVTPAYLGSAYTRSTQVGTQGTGGVTRQPMRVVDKERILKDTGTTIESVSTASASTPKEAASRYFNYVQPALSADNPNKDKYNALPEFAKFKEMPKDFKYSTTINITDTNSKDYLDRITHNSKAAFAQALPDSQPFGNPVTISDKDLLWEKQANRTVPKNILADWNKVAAKDGVPVIKTVTLPDGKVRNILIAKEKNEKGEDRVFIEIVGYNTKQ